MDLGSGFPKKVKDFAATIGIAKEKSLDLARSNVAKESCCIHGWHRKWVT